MEVAAARRRLANSAGAEEPVFLPPSVVAKLSIDDLPRATLFQVGVPKEGVMHLEWSGSLYREGDQILAEADYTWTRKYWYEPIGLEQYLALARRALELRRKTHGDVELTHYEDDGAFINRWSEPIPHRGVRTLPRNAGHS